MGDDAVAGRGHEMFTHQGQGRSGSDGSAIGQLLAGAARLYPLPAACAKPLLTAGVVLGVVGDVLLRASGPPGLNLSLWIAAVALAALALHRRTGLTIDRGRKAWLLVGVVFAAGLAWRDAPPLKLLSLGCATLAFALAAHRLTASWIRGAGVVRYAGALALGALHAWAAAVLVLMEATLIAAGQRNGQAVGWRTSAGVHRVAAVTRGLLIATPLVVVFGGLFMSADAVFERLVLDVVRIDIDVLARHVVLFCVAAWISTGYLGGFLTGTDLVPGRTPAADETGAAISARRPSLGTTEVATALIALDLLFMIFVTVQFRYLFGGDALVQVTPDLTYAEYARRGFFELVIAVVLVVPILLAGDWLLERPSGRDDVVGPASRRGPGVLFRGLASLLIGLVLAVGASALQRLRLYHAIYGLTESRLYAMVMLLWIGAVLVWLAVTVLRGRRESFAFGALATELATVVLLLAVNPDAVVARANVARMASADARARFDVAYATSLSADAVPVLVEALPALPRDVQCPLARHLLRQWPPQRLPSWRSWNWSAARAGNAVREHEAQLRSMVAPDQQCATPDGR